MKFSRALAAVLSAVALFALAARSSAEPTWAVIVDRSVKLDFTPERAFFLIRFDAGPVVQIPAVVVPPFKNDTAEPGAWLVGAKVEIAPGAQTLSSYGFVVGKDRHAAVLLPDRMQLSHPPFSGDSVEQLRAHLMDRKAEFSSLKLQLAEQEATLRRLRQDAEVIGNFGRVVDAREEAVKVKQSIQSVDKDIANLERFARLANSYPAPKNYRSREQQLSVQLSELADAAKQAERGEFSRRQRSEGELQRRLRALEAGRGATLSELEEQLSILRAERQRLEKGGAPAVPVEPTASAEEL